MGIILQNLVDLHMHLGSATTAHLLWEIAHQRGITLPEKNYWKFLELVKIDHKIDFASYHNYFDITQVVQSSPDAIEKSVHEAISLSYRKGNVDLLEIRFNPMRRNKEGLYDMDRVIFSAIVGMKRASMIYPVKAGLILEMDRRFSPKMNRIIVEKAIKFRNEGVVGIDVSGPDNDTFSFSDVKEACEKARSHDLGITIHTGEATSAQEVWDVLNLINPDRIGHGIRSIDDPQLMEKLAEKGTVLEICPTSNIILSLVKNLKEMKGILDTFKKFGVKFTINSDGPVFLNTNVRKELEKLLDNHVLTDVDVKNSLKIARQASFIST